MKKQKQEEPASHQLIDQMLGKQGRTAEDINNLLKQLTKAVLERAIRGELTEHLGYGKHDPAGHNSGNSRNGVTTKTLSGDFGEIELETPRDRNGEFEPRIVKKNQTRWTGFDDKILSMYARGMSTREIQGHLEEMYQVEVSASLISEVTEGVMEQARLKAHQQDELRGDSLRPMTRSGTIPDSFRLGENRSGDLVMRPND